MTFFEFYDLEPTYTLDESALKKKFLDYSRRFHPDHFALRPQEEQEMADEQSSFNNKAYRILSNPDLRLRYLLELHGAVHDEEIYSLDQDFLMDMLDLNDLVEENAAAATSSLDQMEAELFQTISPILSRYEHRTISGDDLKLLKDYHYKKRYILRIRENLNKFAAR